MLYLIKAEINGSAAEQRHAIRLARSAPLLAELKTWMEAQRCSYRDETGSPAVSVLFGLVPERWIEEVMDSRPWWFACVVSLSEYRTRRTRDQPRATDDQGCHRRGGSGSKGEVNAFEPNYEGLPVVCGTSDRMPSATGGHAFEARPGHHLAQQLPSSGKNVFVNGG